MYLAAIIAMIFMFNSAAIAQNDHIHGTTVPDWYDLNCCEKRDCKPVEDKDIEFGIGPWGKYARYKPTGHTFYSYQFKKSQDERYHVCINPRASDNNGALCF